jgi:hypothetical protein
LSRDCSTAQDVLFLKDNNGETRLGKIAGGDKAVMTTADNRDIASCIYHSTILGLWERVAFSGRFQ